MSRLSSACIACSKVSFRTGMPLRMLGFSSLPMKVLKNRHAPSRLLPEARIPHGALLGLEEIEECRAESEIDCQAAAQEDSNKPPLRSAVAPRTG